MSDMSQKNIALVKEGYAAFGRGDIPALLELLAEDVEFFLHYPENPTLGGRYRGRAAVAQFFQRLGEEMEFTLMSPDEFIASGDRVVVLGRQAGRARSTGLHGELEWVHLFTVHNGRVTRFEEFLDSYALARLWEPQRA
ncbi:MAG: nuclear transport factor 2 family protein [Firmicutes bacterium]|nr:nuclear transport factor 2 family protein [Bacillota bacterium]